MPNNGLARVALRWTSQEKCKNMAEICRVGTERFRINMGNCKEIGKGLAEIISTSKREREREREQVVKYPAVTESSPFTHMKGAIKPL